MSDSCIFVCFQQLVQHQQAALMAAAAQGGAPAYLNPSLALAQVPQSALMASVPITSTSGKSMAEEKHAQKLLPFLYINYLWPFVGCDTKLMLEAFLVTGNQG